jgi:LDH2 family malate/lactate/ureidoglycolate dehydrogenase
MGKVRVARNKGEQMKPGILLDGNGKPTSHGVPVDDETWRELTVAARAINVLIEAPQPRA